MKFKSGGQLKDVDSSKGIVSGYFSAFGNVDSDGDVIEKGAFSKTIKENGPQGADRIMHLLQHDIFSPLGKPTELKEDDQGLFFTTIISKTSFGQDALKLYEDGVFNEHSIGFMVVKEESDNEEGVNRLQELKLMEGSTVTWGANPDTPTTDIKGDEMSGRIDLLEKTLGRGNFHDQTYKMLQFEVDRLKSMYQGAFTIDGNLSDLMEPLKQHSTEPPRVGTQQIIESFTKNLNNG